MDTKKKAKDFQTGAVVFNLNALQVMTVSTTPMSNAIPYSVRGFTQRGGM